MDFNETLYTALS